MSSSHENTLSLIPPQNIKIVMQLLAEYEVSVIAFAPKKDNLMPALKDPSNKHDLHFVVQ